MSRRDLFYLSCLLVSLVAFLILPHLYAERCADRAQAEWLAKRGAR